MTIDLGRPMTEKAFATLQARAAIAGLTLTRHENERGEERFTLQRWNLEKTVGSVAAANVLIARLGGPPA